MTLAEQIEALRVRLNATHEEEMGLAQALAVSLLEADAALMREVQGILDGHEHRRGDIVHALQTLAARIGFFPGGPRLPSGQPATGRMVEPAVVRADLLPPTTAERLADVIAAGRGVH